MTSPCRPIAQAARPSLARRLQRQLTVGRTVLFSLAVPVLLLAASSGTVLESAQRYALVIAGLSFIIFVHELGHFLVARLCSVKCEVFSIGIGPRMLGWKKGQGLSFGNEPEPQKSEASSQKPEDLPAPIEKPLGETDYRVSWLPLGGYVRMLGQDDMDPTKVSEDPRAFNNRPIWQRMCIISAGVTMNIIFAILIFAIVFHPSVGVQFPPAIIGQIAYNSAADKTTTADGLKLQMGDRIVAIDHKRAVPSSAFLEAGDLIIASALSSGDSPITYTFVRPGDPTEHDIQITPVREKGAKLLAIGVEPTMPSLNVGDRPTEDLAEIAKSHPEFAQLKPNDSVIKAGPKDQLQEMHSFFDFYRAIQDSHGNPLTIVVQNPDPKTGERTITTTPALMWRNGVDIMTDPPVFLGLSPRTKLLHIEDKSAASAAGLQQDDVVTRVRDTSNPILQQFYNTIAKSPETPITIDILRNDQPMSLKVTPGVSKQADDNGNPKGYLGAIPWFDLDHPVIAGIAPNSAAAKNVIPGSTITAINGQPCANWRDLITFLQNTTDTQVQLAVRDPELHEATVTLPITPADREQLRKVQYEAEFPLQVTLETQRAKTFTDAMVMGLDHTKKFVLQTYLTLAGLFRRTVPLGELHGIVGMAKLGHDIQSQGFPHLLYLLAIISVNLAVANFLPLPIVDGGLFLLLIVEKLRGKPLSLKVLSAIQMVGIALLAGLFIFVTFNDITMFWTK